MNDHGMDLEFHAKDCGLYYEEDCSCFVRWIDAQSGWEDWEEENPPRRSKTAKPKQGESGRSVKLLNWLMRGKK